MAESAIVSESDDPSVRAQLRALTTALGRGDDGAWQTFHEVHGPGLSRYLLVATRGDAHLADEALQQTYLKIARRVPTTDDVGYFKSWIINVARNALADLRRSRSRYRLLLLRRRAEPPELPAIAHASAPDALDVDQVLLSCLDQLPAEPAELLRDKYFRHQSVASLAQARSISVKAAESRLPRARTQLQVLLRRSLESSSP